MGQKTIKKHPKSKGGTGNAKGLQELVKELQRPAERIEESNRKLNEINEKLHTTNKKLLETLAEILGDFHERLSTLEKTNYGEVKGSFEKFLDQRKEPEHVQVSDVWKDNRLENSTEEDSEIADD